MSDGCIEVFLKIMIWTCFKLFPHSTPFLTRLALGGCSFAILDGNGYDRALFLF